MQDFDNPQVTAGPNTGVTVDAVPDQQWAEQINNVAVDDITDLAGLATMDDINSFLAEFDGQGASVSISGTAAADAARGAAVLEGMRRVDPGSARHNGSYEQLAKAQVQAFNRQVNVTRSAHTGLDLDPPEAQPDANSDPLQDGLGLDQGTARGTQQDEPTPEAEQLAVDADRDDRLADDERLRQGNDTRIGQPGALEDGLQQDMDLPDGVDFEPRDALTTSHEVGPATIGNDLENTEFIDPRYRDLPPGMQAYFLDPHRNQS